GGGLHVAGDRLELLLRELRGERVTGLAEAALVEVGHQHVGALERGAARGGEADAGARGGGHHHLLALEAPVAWGLLGDDGEGGFVFGHDGLASRGSPSTRSEMMLRWISLDPP